MRKKTILILVTISVFGLLSYLGYNVISKAKEKNKIAKQLEKTPEFELLTLEQQPFTKANLKPNTYSIFIYFNSECDFCQHEAQSISDNLDEFKEVQFIFISTEPIEVIQKFSEQYNLNNRENIIFLYDDRYTFSSQFHASSVPYVLIYGKNQQLIKKHNGQLNANGILRALNQND